MSSYSKRENSRQYFVCRGCELLEGRRQAKCHISNFNEPDRQGRPTTWTRVCKVHQCVEIPADRILIFQNYDFFGVTAYAKIILTFSPHIMKYSVQLDADENKITCSNRIYVVVDDSSNLNLAGDLIKKNISDSTVIHSATSVQYRACHCHKNVCLNVNFKQEKVFANNCRIGIYLAKTRFMHNPPTDTIPETPSKRGNGSGGRERTSSSEGPVEKKEKTSSTTTETTTTSTDTDTDTTNNFSITLNSHSPLITSSDELELANTSSTITTNGRSINTSRILSVNSYKEKDKERIIPTINEPPPPPHSSLSPPLIQQQRQQRLQPRQLQPIVSHPIPQNNNHHHQQQQQQFPLPNQLNLNNQLIIQIQNYNSNSSSTVFTCPYIPQLKSHFQNCLRSQIPTPIETWKRKWDIFFFTIFNHISTTMTPENINFSSTSGSLLILSTSNFLINEDLSLQNREYSDIPTSEWILSRLKFLSILEEFLYPLYNFMFAMGSLSPNSAFSSLQ